MNPSCSADAPLAAPAAPESLAPQRHRLRSRFADMEISAQDVIAFPDGLPGYETARAFVLIDLPDMAPLKVLHPVDGDTPCFLVVDPTIVLPTFRCDIGPADRLRLGGKDERTLVWLVTVIVDEAGEVAVNLRAPIVIDSGRMIGRQVMPNACVYPLRYVIQPPD